MRPLAVEVDRGVAAAAWCRRVVLVLGLERPQAFSGSGRLDQAAVQGEVLAGEQLVGCGLDADRLREGLGNLAAEQTMAVLREIAKLLAEAALGADRVENLGKLRLQQVLGGDRGPAGAGVEGSERARLISARARSTMPRTGRNGWSSGTTSSRVLSLGDQEQCSEPIT